jgi:hypothetical protein
MLNGSDPFALIERGRFRDAIRAYTELLQRSEEEPTLYNRALAYLNAGALSESLVDIKRMDELNRTRSRGRSDAAPTWIGVIAWLNGKEDDARRTWRQEVEDIEHRRIAYTDYAGGVEPGALLWFSASQPGKVSLRERDSALRFLNKKAGSSRSKVWPGPIAHFLLDKLSEAELLEQAAFDVPQPLWKRQECQARFFIGARAAAQDRSVVATEHFKRATRTNAVLEAELYLARHEAERPT